MITQSSSQVLASVICIFTEPQYNPEMVKTFFGGMGVYTSGVIDPLGVDLVTGVNLYPNLLIEFTDGLKLFLGGKIGGHSA